MKHSIGMMSGIEMQATREALRAVAGFDTLATARR